MLTANEIRERFFQFFREREHRIVPSAPVVPHGDDTLMFTNAGMNQFKDVFLGTGTRPYTRCADTQKCIRVSGKHNDLEEVGVDTYHHTFFEMLGNWSFGDYFKREAIRWGYEFLVDVMKLDPARLYATVFGGDEALSLPPDEEAEVIWPEESGIPPERVLRFGRKDNFWEMAQTGPCGPCSEIHLDLGEAACDRKGEEHRCQVNGDCGRFIEIWNLVFIQYNHLDDGSLAALPARHVDTGMGFERLVSVSTGKTSNYDTDLFTPLFDHLEKLTGVAYGAGERTDVALRVVADHVRTLSVAIADNVVPSNKDRGYVLRRLLRRASRYGYQVLEIQRPFIHLLVPTVAELFGAVFPEIGKRVDHIQRVLKSEERAFLRTLERGVKLFDNLARETEDAARRELDGHKAFELYETYGFPRDLIELLAGERSLTLDDRGWRKAEKEHREASRGAAADQLDLAELEGLPATDFVGYWEQERAGARGTAAEARLIKIVDNAYVILDRSPFYAEAGGQVGDTGVIEAPGFRFLVKDTVRSGDITVHQGDLEQADLTRLPEQVACRVDEDRRQRIMANHTATHLLHWALKEVVSSEANQKGSLVHPDYLRFDFTHDAALTVEQLEQIERRVNLRAAQNLSLAIEASSYQAAIDRGVTALFGEKYGDEVRVVAIDDFSAELCGGTHCRATGEIGLFQIVSEKASSAGVRRIVAETREAAVERLLSTRRSAQAAARLLGVGPDKLPPRVERLLEDLKKARQAGPRQKADMGGLRKRLIDGGVRCGDRVLIFGQVPDLNARQLAELADAVRSGEEQVLGVLATEGDRPALVAFASRVLADAGVADAGALIRRVGKGGGRKDFAKGAAADPAALKGVLEQVAREVRTSLADS